MVCAQKDVFSQIPSTNKYLPGQLFLVTFVGSFFHMLDEDLDLEHSFINQNL